MIAAVILGGGLTMTVSTPAWAVNNFIVKWIGGPHLGGAIPFACDHGKSYDASNAGWQLILITVTSGYGFMTHPATASA
jgi:hypothetical protein